MLLLEIVMIVSRHPVFPKVGGQEDIPLVSCTYKNRMSLIHTYVCILLWIVIA